MSSPLVSVHIVSLGCARNDVDSEELAGRLEAGGFRLVDEPADAEAVVVNTCGFIESAKKDSIDTVLAASDLKGNGRTQRVVAVGCMAERYGRELADALPEADAVLGFDHYADIDSTLRRIMDGDHFESHTPRDRRKLLPLAPAKRQAAASNVVIPGIPSSLPDLPAGLAPASGPRAHRRRLGSGPSAAVKIASGCDRRCAFCAIPSFRGSFVSRPVDDVVEEVRWLVDHGVREAFLVSENTSSYGKDLGELGALERLLGELDRVDGLDWVRVSYLQPAAPAVLRRMRRFGDPDSFLSLIERIRGLAPDAGIRSNVIVGFPGERDADVEILADFVQEARLDALGVFGYSDEEGTEAEGLADYLPEHVVAERAERLSDLAAELVDQRAADRVGERVQVLIEGVEDGRATGRAAHQGPDVDGTTTIEAAAPAPVGSMVWGRVVTSVGADLVVEGGVEERA